MKPFLLILEKNLPFFVPVILLELGTVVMVK